MALFASHLLICLFVGSETSPLALILNLPLLGLFSVLMPAGYFYFLSFKWGAFNWIEPFLHFFIVSVRWGAKLSQASSLNASLPLILVVWMILLKKKKRYLVLMFLCHATLTQAPSVFRV